MSVATKRMRFLRRMTLNDRVLVAFFRSRNARMLYPWQVGRHHCCFVYDAYAHSECITRGCRWSALHGGR